VLSQNNRAKKSIAEEKLKKSDIQATVQIITPYKKSECGATINRYILAENNGNYYVFYNDHFENKFMGSRWPKCMTILSDGNLAILSDDGVVSIYDLGNREFKRRFNHGCFTQYFGEFSVVSLPDGQLAIGSSSNRDDIRIYNTYNGELVKNIEFKKFLSWDQHVSLKGVAAMTAIDSVHIAIADKNGHGNIYIYNLETNSLVNQFTRNKEASATNIYLDYDYLGGLAKLMTTLKNGNLAVFTMGRKDDDPSMVWIYNPMNSDLIVKFPSKQKTITTALQLEEEFEENYGKEIQATLAVADEPVAILTQKQETKIDNIARDLQTGSTYKKLLPVILEVKSPLSDSVNLSNYPEIFEEVTVDKTGKIIVKPLNEDSDDDLSSEDEAEFRNVRKMRH
jgi:hypothetical protein